MIKSVAKFHTEKRTCNIVGARVYTEPQPVRHSKTMKVTVKRWQAIAQWRWDTGQSHDEQDGDEDVCGICRVAYEGCCPSCKMPGDDCPLSMCILRVPLPDCIILLDTVWGECTHVFHMHCIIRWLGTLASKQQCPMDRRPWGMFF